jgi:hypothetical protein
MGLITDQLTGDLDRATASALRDHLETCPGCAAEAVALERLWNGLAEPAGETPSAALRQRFDEMLRRETAGRGAVAVLPSPGDAARTSAHARPRASDRSVRRAALSLALAAALALALGAGIFIGSAGTSRRSAQDLAELREEVRSLRSTVALALLSDASPSERLDGVAYGRELQAEDRRVTDALFATLLEDANVNVRLAALDALRGAAALPETRARLVESIAEQDSPLVQLSAIDLLLESPASDDLSRLTENPAIDTVVRGYLRDRLERSDR